MTESPTYEKIPAVLPAASQSPSYADFPIGTPDTAQNTVYERIPFILPAVAQSPSYADVPIPVPGTSQNPTYEKVPNSIPGTSQNPTYEKAPEETTVESYYLQRLNLPRTGYNVIQEVDSLVSESIDGQYSTAHFYGFTDSVTTTLNFGTGAAITDITIGNGTTIIDVVGDTIVSELIKSSGNSLLLNFNNDASSSCAFATERGATGDDFVFLYNSSLNRFELGLYNTVSGTALPPSALSNHVDLKLNEAITTDITRLGSLTFGATTFDISLTARSSSININDASNLDFVSSLSGNSIIEALNEIKAGNSVENVQNQYTNGESFIIEQGESVYISSPDTVMQANATIDNQTSRVIGVASSNISGGAAGIIVSEGVVDVKFEQSLVISAGDEIWLSTISGLATNIAPSTSGNIIVPMGYVIDASSYDGNTQLLAECHLIPGTRELA